MPIVNKKCDSYMYFLILDFTIQKKKRLPVQEKLQYKSVSLQKKIDKQKGNVIRTYLT